MKRIIEKKVLNILVTKCYDNETNKFYKIKDLKSEELLNALVGIKYSADLFEMTDIEVDDKKPFNKKIDFLKK